MTSHRKTSLIVGVLYITATVMGIFSVVFVNPILSTADYLTGISANETHVIVGGLFELMMAVSVAGIAFMMYPLLKKTSESLALWYVGARLIESMLFIIGTICLLLLVTISQKFARGGASDTSCFHLLGTTLLATRDWVGGALNGTVGFGLSALLFYYLISIEPRSPLVIVLGPYRNPVMDSSRIVGPVRRRSPIDDFGSFVSPHSPE